MNLSINTDRSSEEWAFLNKGILIKVTESILKFCCRNCLNGKYLHICLFQIFSFYSSECKTLSRGHVTRLGLCNHVHSFRFKPQQSRDLTLILLLRSRGAVFLTLILTLSRGHVTFGQ